MTDRNSVNPTHGTATASACFFNDTYEKKEWYLDGSALSPLSIDAYSAWTDYKGAGIKIGVIDSQIDFRHTDLAKAYDASLDYNFAQATGQIAIDDSDLPYYHGTAVAGVISAEANNAYGTVGIASEATLVGLGIDYNSDNVTDQIVLALNASADLDVVNNSWSFTSNFDDNFNRHPEYAEALEHAVSEGRGGLGTSVIFAAGNAGTGGTSNYHNFQNSPYTIAVGAVNADGTPASFTSLGANVLLSAAGSDVYTTTLKDGFKNCSGTSFAAPAVTSTVGLILQANPDLGYRDVQQILAYSARREGLSDSTNFGDGWRTNGATNLNGGGLHFSDAFGYGFLNVHDAVRLAETWTRQQTYANLATVSQSVQVDQTLAAGSNDHISTRIEVRQAIDIEHVQLALDLRWVDTGDLDVYLTSPDGTTVRLVYDLPYDNRAGGLRNFVFDSVASMGEQSAGTWTIDVYNRNPDATCKDGTPMTGLLQDATLTITGSSDNRANDTYIYTDEFGTLYAGADLASRSVLHDTDGGNDTINAAAVTSNSTIDLSAASQTRIAGVMLSFAADTIENAIGGDGNDTLIGSNAANVLHAGRGDDVIYFSFGNDILDGGRGADTLMVNSDFGSISGHALSDGALEISTRTGEVSTVSDVETFVFSDTTYSYDQLLDLFAAGSGDTSQDGSNGQTSDGSDGTTPTYDNHLTGTTESETILGSDTADLIHGMGGNDLIKGGAGDDWIEGGAGRDRLFGGDGADTFIFDVSELDTLDIVYDFNAGEGDRILITGLDANAGATFDFEEHGTSTILAMHMGGETYDVARLKGDAIDHLDMTLHMSTSDLGILWA
ncbi:S8 family serine peptidase [Novosphingobium mangrovi (ex Huang et al. 2023)]|uniref:S8 family serine peptidase n=1 Tax=Novosphingobium mangrovi (ex Huang et al. 2023) TaxID=2976432 RepID=A0ABT2I1M4_9SPHN|nr:S8 family serine peptidase [Novosphingobium mangrovi (ex Huang et al. 2023)]MCT2398707.1 S8 family serine peptidase [Novosphingobium mangrovi (ex Huang et al. 2023)]